ncbi:hypothetical protein BLNAU_19726 [Blattamonas nauphoetae]|uniref:Uncharacterized protein n=1 Tax=Blattamonas nauphoetae TaxID=2049346 RepID=A0ABQ9X0V6_9EUKA|nr:hypothetical protein BLNAU_19726 [Blattamonas nauphoetae]
MIGLWLLVASIALSIVGMICAMYLYLPVNFMNQLRFIVCQLLTILGSEFIFIGTFFSAAQTFAPAYGSTLTSVISIGGGPRLTNLEESNLVSSMQLCHYALTEGDCVRMEMDMHSTPRTVQFLLNGESSRWFVTGLPPSVRIGFSVFAQETSFRIDRIVKQTQPTPMHQYIPELKHNLLSMPVQALPRHLPQSSAKFNPDALHRSTHSLSSPFFQVVYYRGGRQIRKRKFTVRREERNHQI